MQLLLRRLWIQITADRRRFAILCAMVAIGMLLWARIIVTASIPRTATARPDPNKVETPKGGSASDKPPVALKLARNPLRDPLVISDADFPKHIDVGDGGEDGKSGPETDDNVKQAELRLIAELKALVSKFRLEGVMLGNPMAVINGQTYQIRAWITHRDDLRHKFQLVEVGDRSVTLECEGHLFQLMMENPGSDKR